MGHYRSEMCSESPSEEKERLREQRIREELEKLPLSAFTVAELPALLVYLGFKADMRSRAPTIWEQDAERLLEKKLQKLKKK